MPTLPALMLSVLLSLGASASAPTPTVPMVIGDLTLEWPEGYSIVAQGDRNALIGPGDHRASATVWAVTPPNGDAGLADALATLTGVAQDRLPGLADSFGEVVVELREDTLPDGTRLYSTATRTPQPGAKIETGFYLQYMLVSPTARAALVTVEGSGDALEQHARFLGHLRTAAWAAPE